MVQLLHRTLFLPGPVGRLEAVLWSVPEREGGARPPRAAVVCHPHPLFGGTMHNKVVYQTAKTLHRFGLPVLRFNFRGTGLSEGKHDEGRGEQGDVSAALDFLAAEFPGAPLLLAGFSFGSWVGLRVACSDPRVTDLIGLGLPVGSLGYREFSYLDACDKPKLLVSGELDRYGPPEKLEAMAGRFSPHVKERTSVAIISGADHFFAGRLAELDRTIATWLVERHPGLVAHDA
ncbi:MAG: alpha/beta hydrolase [Acidobacteriia bacterium]|nr:alpha/beta hydrolase [Terriglobia bacterium]